MKNLITILILLAGITLNIFAQQEIPMFFDSELGLQIGLYGTEIAYSSDGSKIATTFNNTRSIVIWDAVTCREITKIAGHNGLITNIVFSPNGRLLASIASLDPIIKIWDTVNGGLIRNITLSGVRYISFKSDGNNMATAYNDRQIGDGVKIWNMANGNELRTIEHTARVQSVTYSPDGRYILTASSDGIRIWNEGNGQLIRTISNRTRFMNAVYSPNGRYIAATHDGDNINGIRVFNAETGQEIRYIPIRLNNYRILFFSSDSRQLFINTREDSNASLKMFNIETGQELQSFSIEENRIAFSNDNRIILTASGSLGGFELKIGNDTYRASYANILDSATGRKVGVIGYGPLNIGAKAFADLQIARFLNDAAAVSRNEAILNFITGRGDATRAEIEAFYRNNVRAQIEGVVDREFRGITVPVQTVTYVKQSLTNFFTTPNQANFDVLKNIFIYIQWGSGPTDDFANAIYNTQGRRFEGEQAALARLALEVAQNMYNEQYRGLNIPNNAKLDWDSLQSSYRKILTDLYPELFRTILEAPWRR